MGKYLLAVPSAANAGRDDEYNQWYGADHLNDVLAIPGVVSGKRFKAEPTSPNAPPQPELASYELELDDPSTFFTEMGRRAQTGEMKISPALDTSSAQLWLFKAQ
ncbi:MAG TPA: hypothetical protein VF442_11030 [Sphingobium sp.]